MSTSRTRVRTSSRHSSSLVHRHPRHRAALLARPRSILARHRPSSRPPPPRRQLPSDIQRSTCPTSAGWTDRNSTPIRNVRSPSGEIDGLTCRILHLRRGILAVAAERQPVNRFGRQRNVRLDQRAAGPDIPQRHPQHGLERSPEVADDVVSRAASTISRVCVARQSSRLRSSQCTMTGSACRSASSSSASAVRTSGENAAWPSFRSDTFRRSGGVGQALPDAAHDVVETERVGVRQERRDLRAAHRAGDIGAAQLSAATPPAAAPSSRTARARR